MTCIFLNICLEISKFEEYNGIKLADMAELADAPYSGFGDSLYRGYSSPLSTLN